MTDHSTIFSFRGDQEDKQKYKNLLWYYIKRRSHTKYEGGIALTRCRQEPIEKHILGWHITGFSL